MKKIILALLITNYLIASNDTNATSLDMFLFKIGFKAMANDLDKQKELSISNEQRIKQLENKIKELLDINKKQKINNINLLNNITTEFTTTIKDINKTNIVQNNKVTKYKIAIVAMLTTNIQEEPKSQSKLLWIAKKHDILKIEKCQEYGWCKLYNQNAYVAKYRLKF